MEPILIHYHELALKGKNKRRFLEQLRKNITKALASLANIRVQTLQGALVVEGNRENKKDICAILAHLPGIANIMPAYRVEQEIAQAKNLLNKELKERAFANFRIEARRADKTFPLSSMEINEQLGAWVKQHTGAQVKLKNPERTIFVEVFPGAMYIGFEKLKGQGGLPVGSSAPVLSLLSGGIDSPVASWMMMRRGCRLTFLHFHSYPYLDKTSQKKAEKLAAILKRHQTGARLYLVGLGDIQREVMLKAKAVYRVILYRRFMMRIAEEVAKKEGCAALVTGENIGQVASQTVENIATIEAVSSLPILRPLIGMHKEEIIEKARILQTYETSILPDKDCCQLFVPKQVATKSKRDIIEEVERAFDIKALVKKAIHNAQVKDFE